MSVQAKIDGEMNDQARAQMMGRDRVPLNDAAAAQVLQRRIQEARVLAQTQAVRAVPPGPGLPLERGGRERVPFGAMEQTLAHPPIPGFRLYWANNTPGRVARFKQAGYEHVLDEEGKPISRCVDVRGGGGGIDAYLMKIPLQWYYEDMSAQQDLRDRTMQDIKDGRMGEKLGKNQYVPRQGITIQDQRR
jgi:hypothetical protein